MIVLGLTGSIGTGKSVAALQLRRLGLPVFDADAVVHRLLAQGGGAVAAVAKAFPEAVIEGAVDRARLGRIVFADQGALHRLESIIHPLVDRARQIFLRDLRRRRQALAILDIPLLFEGRRERLCDVVAVVSCPEFLQHRRVMARPGMTEARFAAIKARQLGDAEKRRRADFVISTGIGLRNSLRSWVRIVQDLRSNQPSSRRRRCAR